MNRLICASILAASCLFCGQRTSAQDSAHSEADEQVETSDMPMWTPRVDGTLSWTARKSAVAGYENAFLSELKQDLSGTELNDYSPRTDNVGNLIITFGTGHPLRLIVTPVDEPGYVVSEITEDGYLRVQRLPQSSPSPVFDALHFAQPVVITARENKSVSGVFAGLSVHLQPGRMNGPKMNHPEEMYVDIGAKSADEVQAAGVRILDPIVLADSEFYLGRRLDFSYGAGKAEGDRFGVAALLELLPKLKLSKSVAKNGTTIVAFVTQSWTGGRGLNRLLEEVHPDEMIYVGRLSHSATSPSESGHMAPGDGVILGVRDAKAPLAGLAALFQELSNQKHVPLKVISAEKPRIATYAKPSEFPEQFVQLGVATSWPVTPAEVVSASDVLQLEQLIEGYLHIYGAPNEQGLSGESQPFPVPPSLPDVVKAYGASGHEISVVRIVFASLPKWAQEKVTTDAAGNLVLHVGDGKSGEKTPRIAFVAHMDEIGYEVMKIESDGRLQVEALGGGYPQYFLGHMVLVHKLDGNHIGGVLELPEGWDRPGFEWPSGAKSMDEPAHVYVGTKSKAETEKLGIATGHFVTIPKEYRPLLGTRANARSFDDRVGCEALITAVNALGPELPGRDVTFVWSTEEEVGLKGAAAFAEQAAKEGRVPDFVFAIDTFVSSDSPLESKRFADAKLGEGFVVRAVDNSNLVPREYVDRVVALAKENAIPVQYGVTGGGNDGSVFLRYGSVDVALGWPLRYAHSPAEVIDTKDLDALGKIVEVIARKW
jgi:putative aminopeptidase